MSRPVSLPRPVFSVAGAALLVGVFLLGVTCVPEAEPGKGSDQVDRSIVGGVTETGYPAVGAMTFVYPGYGYGGSSCSGTLVGSRWVLTAAHCMGEVGGIDLEANPQVIHFYIGSNANPGPSGWPSSGTLHQADAVYVHSQYNPQSSDHDIALVRLAAPISSVTPIPFNENSMTSAWIGQNVTYVGFGVSSGINNTGGGVKRRGQNPIYSVWPGAYQSNATGGVGVCFGDSGGPGLMSPSGTTRVVGINSAVSSGSNPDPCLGYGYHTRVDAYVASFLSPIMGTPLPNCQTNPAVCPCAAACQPDGSCNNTACETLSCEEIWDCIGGCATNDQGCMVDCYYKGTAQGRAAFDALQTCMYDNCEGAADLSACVGQYCLSEYYGCFPPADCDITGGECDAQEACYPAQGGHTDCYPSNGKGEGQACNPNLTDRLDCGDGLVCITLGSTSECLSFCQEAGHCGQGDYCHMPIFQGIPDIGVCLCIDEDNDGWCQVDDCDDNDRYTYPGATERCGDGKDNNCNGEIDEGCEVCVDEDGDGYCATEDCDDTNPNIHPGAVERCGDGVDNNCDGQIDEGCATCVDADEDGYCAEVDCDDNDHLTYPGAVERCFDGKDNNCNGIIDEGCDNCHDNDGDGYCSDVDCHDGNPNIHPGAPEICFDGVDNNCDGQIDEGCPCVDQDGDGYCQGTGPMADCDDTNPHVNPGMGEVCGNGVDDNCNGLVDEGCEADKGCGCNHQAGASTELPLLVSFVAFVAFFLRRRRASKYWGSGGK